MSNGGYANIILPGVFGNPGDALDQSIALKERRNERDAAMQQRQYEEQQRQRQQDDYRKANLLDKQANDIAKYHTGEQQFDGWVDKKAEEILNKYTNDPAYRNMDIATFSGNLNRDWLPIIQGYGAVKGKMQQELSSVNDITAQQKWVNKDALTNQIYGMIAHEYMQPDGQGGFTFKPLDKVDHNRSFTSEILDSPDAYKLVNDAAIDDFTKNIAEAKGENRNYLLHNPDGSVSHFKGNLSPFETENIKADDKGFVKQAPSYGIVTEGRTDASGNPINTLPEDVIKNYMANTTGRQKAMQKLFFDHAEQMGIDVSKLSPKQLSDEMQKFAYTAVKGTRNNQPDLFAYNQPTREKTSNSFNFFGFPGSTNGLENTFKNIDAALKVGDTPGGELRVNERDAVTQLVKNSMPEPYGKVITPSNIVMHKDANGKIWATLKPEIDKDQTKIFIDESIDIGQAKGAKERAAKLVQDAGKNKKNPAAKIPDLSQFDKTKN